MTLGIYIQVPFCQSKCTYCNFHTGVFSSSLYSPYASAVCREIAGHVRRLRAAGIEPVPAADVDTVYVGGGTPSLLDAADLSGILESLRDSFAWAGGEVTLEADPETITDSRAAAWGKMGFNRASLGAQSFQDVELKAAGRMHRREDIPNAARTLRAAGFENISLDLIAGLPRQTAATWEESLDRALEVRPEHFSVYLMELDEDSRLGREALAGGSRYSARELPDDDAMAAFYERACERLATAGYQHYEISNWALPGFRSQHNLKYWRRQPYLGFGAGAHSFNGVQRWANPHDPAAYAAAVRQGSLPVEQLEALTSAQALDEEWFLGLRQLEGIDLARIEAEYNVSLAGRIALLRESGLVETDGSRVRLAANRLAISNEVFVELMN